MNHKLLSIGNDAKTVKGEKKGVITGILYMAPAQVAGGKNMCPFSTAGCRAVCLYTAGRGGFNSVQQARIKKTLEYQKDPVHFVNLLADDVMALMNKAAKLDMIPAVRLNGTTDVLWERGAGRSLMEQFSDVQFYDYTKFPPHMRKDLPPNYHLTFSYSESPHAEEWSEGWFERGVNTAAVFAGGLPATWHNRPVIDGDESDLRFTDPKGVIVGLKTKGKARGVVDAGTGFVQLGKAA